MKYFCLYCCWYLSQKTNPQMKSIPKHETEYLVSRIWQKIRRVLRPSIGVIFRSGMVLFAQMKNYSFFMCLWGDTKYTNASHHRYHRYSGEKRGKKIEKDGTLRKRKKTDIEALKTTTSQQKATPTTTNIQQRTHSVALVILIITSINFIRTHTHILLSSLPTTSNNVICSTYVRKFRGEEKSALAKKWFKWKLWLNKKNYVNLFSWSLLFE